MGRTWETGAAKKRAKEGVQAAGKALEALLYPGRALCLACGSAIGQEKEWICPECARKLRESWLGSHVAAASWPLFRVAHAYRYQGPASALVQALKYQGARVLAEGMARDMSVAFYALMIAEEPLVVPAPTNRMREFQRGYNQAEALSRAIARELSLEHGRALKKTRSTPRQTRLSAEERERNLENSMVSDETVRGRDVLLVDDVFTTGATARACAEALYQAGARRVYALTYAVARRSEKAPGAFEDED